MAGISFEDMPPPRRSFRPDRDTRRPDGQVTFEALSATLREDATRAGLTLKSVEQIPEPFVGEAIGLANKLAQGAETHVPSPTLASSLFMRSVRIRVIGNLWPLVENEALGFAATATLRPMGMWVPSSELHGFQPHVVNRRLKADIYRADIHKLKGYMLVGLHSEFDVNRGGYDFHYHIVAGGEMADAIDALRDVGRFSSGRIQPHEAGLPESARIIRSRDPLYNLPEPLTYVLQSSHPHRPTTLNSDGSRTRSNRRYRIPEPHHTQWLLWMNRLRTSDLLFCVGMAPTTSGFKFLR